eukprot:SAG31_NODE_7755_length_1602_cov_186.656021_1_plen_153_part_00
MYQQASFASFSGILAFEAIELRNAIRNSRHPLLRLSVSRDLPLDLPRYASGTLMGFLQRPIALVLLVCAERMLQHHFGLGGHGRGLGHLDVEPLRQAGENGEVNLFFPRHCGWADRGRLWGVQNQIYTVVSRVYSTHPGMRRYKLLFLKLPR